MTLAVKKSSAKHASSGKESSNPVKRVPLAKVHPNPWNMNQLAGIEYQKLKNNIQQLFKSGKKVPPIIVRPHEEQKGDYEIIDGEHRWKVYKDLGKDKIPIFVMDVSTSEAIVLTNNLNYLRGKRDPKKYIKALHRLTTEFEVPMSDLTKLLPEGKNEIIDLLDSVEIDEAVDLLGKIEKEEIEKNDKRDKDAASEDEFVELKFVVPMSAAPVVEREITRIENELRGDNRRGRALEYMAVLSSQTPLTLHDEAEGIKDAAKKKVKKLKKKKKKRHNDEE